MYMCIHPSPLCMAYSISGKHLIEENGKRTHVVVAVRRQYSITFALVDVMC